MTRKPKAPPFVHEDPFLQTAVREFASKYKCHTVLLYGSRARGDATRQSDYDLMGVRKSGPKLRVAEKRGPHYLDGFVFAEKDLQKLGEQHLYMKEARVLVDPSGYGSKLLRKLGALAKQPPKRLAADEANTRRVWAHKMLERIALGDIEANYRRSWLHETLLIDYFELRQLRFGGSKESFAWLKKHDRATYQLFDHVLSRPTELALLKKLVARVTQRKSP